MVLYGIELENYVSSWRNDGDCTEVEDKPHKDFRSVLNFVKRQVEENKDEMFFHSYPSNKEGSCSAHIHRSPSTYQIYSNLFRMTNIFQFFFKNSPRSFKGDLVLSWRQRVKHWCDFVRLTEPRFYAETRDSFALTPNPAFHTIEFRYNDFPKSLNQLSLYYYINRIINRLNQDTELSFEHDLIFLDTFKDLNKNHSNNNFSFNNPSSAMIFNSDYKDIITYYSRDLDILFSKWKFYDFYSESYKPFSRLIRNMFNKERDIFKKYFDNRWTDQSWSSFWGDRFIKKIPEKLIITGE